MYLVFEFDGYLCVYLFYTVSPHSVLCPSRELICGKQLKKKKNTLMSKCYQKKSIDPAARKLKFYLFIFNFNLFLSGGYLLYNIVLVSAMYQHESAIGIYMSPPA